MNALAGRCGYQVPANGETPTWTTPCQDFRERARREKGWKLANIMVIDNVEYAKYDDMYYVSKDGDVYSKYCNRLIKHSIDHDGYHRVDIHGSHVKVHRLVWAAWVEDPSGKQSTM